MIVRRMKVQAASISTPAAAHLRPAQLALALGGQVGHAYAYSPIVTNLIDSAFTATGTTRSPPVAPKALYARVDGSNYRAVLSVKWAVRPIPPPTSIAILTPCHTTP